MNILNRFSFSFVVMLTISIFPLTAQAATYIVTNTDNDGPGSLREAVGIANSTPDDDTINFNIPVTDPNCMSGICTIEFVSDVGNTALYIYPAGKLTIAKNLSANKIIIDANGSDRVFLVKGGADLTLNEITVTGGYSGLAVEDPIFVGSGIYNQGGNVTLINSTVRNNTGTQGQNAPGAGGITNHGNLTLIGSTVSNNSGYNGGIFSEGTATLTDSIVDMNGGIGIENSAKASLTVDHSIIKQNTNAGIKNNGTANITTTFFTDQSGAEDIAIFNLGALTLTDSTLTDNIQGVYQLDGTLKIINSSLSRNGVPDGGAGGAMRIDGGLTTILNSTFSSNQGVFGGAICLFPGGTGVVSIINSTIARNTSLGDGGGIVVRSGSISIRNTIIANNISSYGPDIADDDGLLTSLGNNLIGNTAESNTVWQPTDILNEPARLGPLGNYGGPTQTFALTNSSPAINAGNSCVITLNGCGDDNPALASDQRGAARVDAVDIGAFERNNPITGGQFRAVTTEGKTNTPYSYLITSDSGAFSYSVTGGSLPTGLSLTNSARPAAKNALIPAAGPYSITGTPTMGGTYDYTITATDGTNVFVVHYSTTIVTPPPTAASVNVGGRVIALGRGLANARVVLADQNGQTRMALSNAFGYYQFDNVLAGETYIISITSKRYQFAPQLISVATDVTDLEFTAE